MNYNHQMVLYCFLLILLIKVIYFMLIPSLQSYHIIIYIRYYITTILEFNHHLNLKSILLYFHLLFIIQDHVTIIKVESLYYQHILQIQYILYHFIILAYVTILWEYSILYYMLITWLQSIHNRNHNQLEYYQVFQE